MGDKSAAAKFAADAIVRGGLGEYSMMIPAALSYGIKRRVSLLRAEICAKGAFFCDEPNQVSDGRYKNFFSEILRKRGMPERYVSSLRAISLFLNRWWIGWWR